MHQLIQDLRYALRQSRKNLGVTLTVVLVLAVGIAANAVTFTVLKATLLRPLPYFDPNRLVQLWNSRNKGTASHFEFSYPDFADYRDQNDIFEILDGYSNRGATVRGPQGAERLSLTVCGAQFFNVLQVKPALGRLFLPGEDLPQGQLDGEPWVNSPTVLEIESLVSTTDRRRVAIVLKNIVSVRPRDVDVRWAVIVNLPPIDLKTTARGAV